MKPIAFIDLAAQQQRIREKLDARIATVLDHGQYIMGQEVSRLEEELAEYCGVSHAISCSSGTDALMLGLIALGVRPSDAVIVPSFTFAATAEVLPCLGAIPVFADIDHATFNLDPDGLEPALAAASKAGVKTVGIIPVGLFGQPANMDRINAFAEANGLWVMDDAAQSFGTEWNGIRTGRLGAITATSFFPAKPLGCYGDGGAVFTDDDDYAEVMRSARIHGMGRERYYHDRYGMTARMDTLQATILSEKLTIFAEELDLRQAVANRYNDGLGGAVETPAIDARATSSWAQYCIRLAEGSDRGAVQAALKERGIPTAIYYPMGMHQQPPYARFPVAEGGLPVTADNCSRVLALPMHPYLDAETQQFIIDAVVEITG
ncbi:MAG: UDP-2-acetamido-2-deoxy-3-oxo-D-glucuronate aminotransferase [SAR116 cluster bacterium MED-G04]|nr:MAG: UDP-2-acetamido-2-deoxy-3-oxo-D-glucuronate aminotransferase [SAR116 cluster bacterium MED-G04]